MGYGGPSNLSAELARKALSADEQSAQEHDASEALATLDHAELRELETHGTAPQASLSVGTATEPHRASMLRVPVNYLVALGFILLAIAAILLTVLPQAT